MICPICGNKLEQGSVLTYNHAPGLFYVPKGEMEDGLPGGLLKVNRKKLEKQGGIALAGPYSITPYETKLPATVCRTCRKVILDY